MDAEKGSAEFEAWFSAEYPNTHANCEKPDHQNDQIIKAFTEVSWRHSRKAATAKIDKLKAENEALRKALREVMTQVDGNIRETVRDCVNGHNDVQDIYGYCDVIEGIVGGALLSE